MARLRAEAARSAMEFDALRARLNPHFIFNALNNLRALINEDTERARDLVTRLSNTLRHALDHGSAGSVPLRRELEVVDDYLEIEKVHYEDRLQVQRDIAPEAAGAELPPMLLQLLVENAIKHGIARTPGGGSLSVQARMEGKLLRLAVENPGRLEGGTRGHGVGLSYLRSRLAQGAGEFTLTQQGDRVRATLDIPQ
jgi:LytS/YehU family sensor histidine kinase